MEPNPYESPKTKQPLERSQVVNQVVKRSIGLAVTLLLTPPAMVILTLTCCEAAALNRGPYIMFGVPLGMLMVQMIIAAAMYRSENAGLVGAKPRIALLLATPFCVAASIPLGFVLAAGLYGSNVEWLIIGAFWLPPAAVLLLMLGLAWRFR